MPKWLLVVESTCLDPRREAEFHDWYDNVHVKDLFGIESRITRATRYEVQQVLKSTTGEKSRFLAMYEIEADDLQPVLDRLGSEMPKLIAEGRMSPLMESTSRVFYRQIGSVENHSRKADAVRIN